ncbi:hypothetical protein Unana1_04457 [Umbelopsis nana]
MEAVGLRKRADSYYLNIAYGETIDEVVQGAIERTDKPMDVVAIEETPMVIEQALKDNDQYEIEPGTRRQVTADIDAGSPIEDEQMMDEIPAAVTEEIPMESLDTEAELVDVARQVDQVDEDAEATEQQAEQDVEGCDGEACEAQEFAAQICEALLSTAQYETHSETTAETVDTIDTTDAQPVEYSDQLGDSTVKLEVPDTQPPVDTDAGDAVINDSRACIDDQQDETHIPKDETFAVNSSNVTLTDKQVCPGNQEGDVADLTVSSTEKPPLIIVDQKDEADTTEPEKTFKWERRRKMSILRLSDAFMRSKPPCPDEPRRNQSWQLTTTASEKESLIPIRNPKRCKEAPKKEEQPFFQQDKIIASYK